MSQSYPTPIHEDVWGTIDKTWWRGTSSSHECPGRQCAPPPFQGPGSALEERDDAGDIDLNTDLVGVKIGLEAIRVYEADVGFYYGQEGEIKLENPSISRPLRLGDVDNIDECRQRWDDLVRDLVQGAISGPLSPLEKSVFSSTSSPSSSTSSFFELTDSSDLSTDSSPPSTPKPQHQESNDNIIINRDFPSPSASPSKLNVSASLFVPTAKEFTSQLEPCSPSPIYTAVPKPTSPQVTLKRDEQGFFNAVTKSTPQTPKTRPSSALLPEFLTGPSHRTRKASTSKTRAIVDGLKASSHREAHVGDSLNQLWSRRQPEAHSQQNEAESSTSCGDSEAADGWIKMDASRLDDSHARAQRTRELFLALRRHRATTSEESSPSEGSPSSASQTPLSPSPVFTPGTKSRPQRQSSRPTSAKPSTPAFNHLLPMPYYSTPYPANPHYAAAAYLQMQMQAHMMAQQHMLQPLPYASVPVPPVSLDWVT